MARRALIPTFRNRVQHVGSEVTNMQCLNYPKTVLPAARPMRAMRLVAKASSAAAAPLPTTPGPAVRLAGLASGLLQSAVKSVKLAAAEYKRQTMEQVGRRGHAAGQRGAAQLSQPLPLDSQRVPYWGVSGRRTSTSRLGQR